MEELKQCRMQQRNIATTIDKLTHCLPGNTNLTLPHGKNITSVPPGIGDIVVTTNYAISDSTTAIYVICLKLKI